MQSAFLNSPVVLASIQKGTYKVIFGFLDSVLKLQEVYIVSVGEKMRGVAPEPSSALCGKRSMLWLFFLHFNKRNASGSYHLWGVALVNAFKLEIIPRCFLDVVYGAYGCGTITCCSVQRIGVQKVLSWQFTKIFTDQLALDVGVWASMD